MPRTTETKTTKKTAPKKIVVKAKTKTPKVKITKTEKPEKIKPELKTYNVFFGGQNMETHPQGRQPKQAARKAITAIFMSMVNSKKDPKKVASIEKYLDKSKKNKKGNVIKTPKYKDEMKKYEESLSKEFMDKYYLFYLIQKSPRIRREYRHYYYGMRQTINPDVNHYLTKVDPKLSKEEIKKLKKEGKDLPKIIIDEKEYKGELVKDKDGKVIEIKIPHYETQDVLDKDGKPMRDEKGKKIKERIPGKKPRIIPYKYSNVVAKLTPEFYEKHKDEFNLDDKQKEELMNHFNHVRPPKIETKREIKAREAKEAKKAEKKAKEAAKKAAKKEKKNTKTAKKPVKKDKKTTPKTAAKKPVKKTTKK